MTAKTTIENFGLGIEAQMINTLHMDPVREFDSLLVLQNLAGHDTGYVKVFSGERISKASSLSINMAPGMRYFNIHIIPDAAFDVPRFVFEGMVSTYGSQISMDFFSDIDEFEHLEKMQDTFTGVREIYDEARQDKTLRFEASRQMHMRVMASPFFLLTFGVAAEHLGKLEAYAGRYWREWIGLHGAARPVPAALAESKQAHRARMKQILIDNDPDRARVVEIYGEDTTQAIESASML